MYILGICILCPLLTLYGIISYKNQKIKQTYSNLTKHGMKVFSTLTGYYTIVKNGKKIHIYTYLTPDKIGNKHEITEAVDAKTAQRLRVGDTLITYTDAYETFGNKKIVSHIPGNSIPGSNYDFLVVFFKTGIFFSISLIIVGHILQFLHKLKT